MPGSVETTDVRSVATLIEHITQLADELRTRLATPCEERGLSESRFAVLLAVAEAGGDGCSQAELASRLGLSESNVCALVERMRKAGLLFRFRSKTDRRRSVLLLSEEGSCLSTAVQAVRDSHAAALLNGLDHETVDTLHRLLERVRNHLESVDLEVLETRTPQALRRAS